MGSQLGEKARRHVSQGELVPSLIINNLIRNRLDKCKNYQGYVFDGYPRNIEQNENFLKIIKDVFGDKCDIYALEIWIEDREAKERLENRLACICGAVYHKKYNPPKSSNKCDICGKKLFIRSDDKPNVIKRRLKVYHQESEPLLKFWEKSDKLIKINGDKSISLIHQGIVRKLKTLGLLN